MGASRRRLFLMTLKVVDLLILATVFLLAAVPVWRGGDQTTFAEFLSMRIKVENFVLFFGLLGIWHILFVSLGVYQSQRTASQQEEFTGIFRATSGATIFLGLSAILFRIRMVTPTYLLVFWFLTTCMVLASRWGLRFFLESLRRRGRNIRHVLIVGTNSPRHGVCPEDRIQTRIWL